MNSNALVYPGTWKAGTPSLGTLDLTYVAPIKDASHYWSALQLPAGPMPAWTDRISGAVLAPPSPAQAPILTTGARKVARFNKEAGQLQRVGVTMDLTGPRTFAVVGAFHAGTPGQYLTYGSEGATFWNIYQGTNGNYAFSVGKTLASNKPGDNKRHVFLVVSNGANSVLNIDGQEWLGDAGSSPAPGFRIGAGASAYYGMDIEAVVVLPFAADVERRNSLVGELKAQYKV